MFDEDRAERVVRFVRSLRHSKGQWAGRAFDLLPWQERFIRSLFGTIREDGLRQYRTCYIEIGRKNGKSTILAALALYMLFADGEAGGEVYGAAGDRDQASIVFNLAASMVRAHPSLRDSARIIDYSKRIIVTKGPCEGSVFRAIPADAAGSHGFNASAVLLDEAHVQPNRDLWDVLTTSTASRAEPLSFAITTAGFDRNSICWELHEHSRQVADGVVQDPTWLPVIYSAPDGADWRQPETWKTANPSLGYTVTEEYFDQQVKQATMSPAYENTFRRLHLCQWTQSSTRFLPMHEWDACNDPIDAAQLAGRTCYGGIDLASTTDLAAMALAFPGQKDEDPIDILMHFWVPEARLAERARRDRVPYQHWVDAGLITATEGDVVDYAVIERDIKAAAERYRLPQLAVDRLFNAEYLAQRVDGSGIEVERKGMGFLDMSWPTKELLRLVLQHHLRHGGNAVLRWMADNLTVETDAAGNVKPSKSKSTQKIDGIVALVLALDLALRHKESTYDLLESVY